MLEVQKITVSQVPDMVKFAPPRDEAPMKKVGDHLFRFWLEEAFWKDFEESLAL